MKNFDLSLYLVTDRPLSRGRDMQWIVGEALRGGCTMVQLREKDCSTSDFVALASELKSLLAPTGVPLLINDRIDVALAVDADGVHIGQSDMPYPIARRLLGPDKIIGLSVENASDLDLANRYADLDYIGISPIFATDTKHDTKQPFGLEGAREVMSRSLHPAVGIGGMNRKTAHDVIASGVDGIAVVSDIVAADNPRQASCELLQQVRAAQGSWCRNVWQCVQPVWQQILSSPFVGMMAAGTLPQRHFQNFLRQDIAYLRHYADEMRQLSLMMPEGEEHDLFIDFVEDAMNAEKEMEKILCSSADVQGGTMSSAVQGYLSHTMQYVNANDLSMSIASLLPCMWLYHEMGRCIQSHQRQGNPYSQWIACYTSPLMEKGIPVMQRCADRLAATESVSRCAAMRWAFCTSARHELALLAPPAPEAV